MYILVRAKDNVIVGTAIRKVDEIAESKKGCKVYEIDDSDFTPDMLGSKLESFEN